VIDLFEALMRGDVAAALAELRDQYDTGAEPAVVLSDLAELTHLVTRVKIVPAVADDPALIESERTRGRALAEKLSMRVLSRTWQMLLKGIAEVTASGRPLAAAEMVLVRIAYAADLPTPDEVIRTLEQGGSDAPAPSAVPAAARAGMPAGARLEPARVESARGSARTATAPAREPMARLPDTEPSGAPVHALHRFDELIALAAEKRDIGVKLALERDVRLVRCEDGRLEVRLEPTAAPTLVNDLARKLSQWTNRRWMVVVSAEEGEPTVKSRKDAEHAELKIGVRADPLVQAVLARFPGAEIVDVRKADAEVPVASEEGSDLGPDPEYGGLPLDDDEI
jgi:DNA polymerase-3 subunit gamma/tau